jgi:hypothetical protein
VADDLVNELLAKPVGSNAPTRRQDPDKHFTRQIEVDGDRADVTVRGPAAEVTEGEAADVLRRRGLDPADWVATGFRTSEWTMPGGMDGLSTRFTFARAGSPLAAGRPPLEELLAAIETYRPTGAPPQGEHGFLVLAGDFQFGKIDGDGVAGTLARTIEGIDRAADRLTLYRKIYDIGPVHIGFLGDHIEGFQSQGGANVWRTQLTLSEQIRLTRRVMLHAMMTFAPLTSRLTMAAVPGNHGETTRFAGKGVTRHDDSHDTESLIAVADAAALAPDKFNHVQFYVPATDEMTVVTEVAGTVVAHAHGHQWRPGRHFEWWRGQAFDPASAMHDAHLLVAGHLHHEFIDTDGLRTFIQAPSMESESTWWKLAKGSPGAPGLIVAITKDGATPIKEIVR